LRLVIPFVFLGAAVAWWLKSFAMLWVIENDVFPSSCLDLAAAAVDRLRTCLG
jgi:hypothetical protein